MNFLPIPNLRSYRVGLGLVLAVGGCTKKPPLKVNEPASRPVQAEAAIPKLSPAFTWPPASSEPLELVPEGQRTDKNYYVVLDGSGSMRESKCAQRSAKATVAMDALQRFINEIPQAANLGLLIFDEAGISERVPLAKNNRADFGAALQKMRVGGGTPLKTAINKGRQRLEVQARKQSGCGEYHLIIVTDGESDEGEQPNTSVDRLVEDTPIAIHTVGFCIGIDHSLNQPKKTSYRAADSYSELLTGLKEVLAESEVFQVTEFK